MTSFSQRLPTPQAFNTLNRAEQLDVLRRATSRQKLRLLVDAAEGAALLAMIPPQDLYLLAREFGPDQIPELLAMATPEQWTALFDFDCWEDDRFDAVAARNWLAVLLEGQAEQVATVLQEIDFELLVLMVHRDVQVLSGPEDLLEEDALAEAHTRAAGGYVLEYRDENAAKLFGAMIDLLYREAPGFCRYLLEAVRGEAASLLEESVYQQRSHRLLDQGLPDQHSAQSVFAWLDPATFAAAPHDKIPLGGSAAGVPPQVALQLGRPGGVLAEVLAEGINAGLGWELACLVNKVLIAESVDLGNLEQVRGVVERTFALLNVALEHLGGCDVAVARRTLDVAYAEELFRVGFSLTLRLQRRAQVVQASPIGPYLDRPFRAIQDALLRRRPQFPVSLTDPGRTGLRSFACLRDVQVADAALSGLEGQCRLFERHLPFPLPVPDAWKLEGCHPQEGSELTLSTLFLTGLANQLLGRAFVPVPLPVGELQALHALVSCNGRLDPQLRAHTLAWLEGLDPAASAFGAYCLDLWDEEFCAATAESLDPRYVGGLIIRLTTA